MDKALQEKIDTFFTHYKQQLFKKGELLIRADDNPPGVFYLVDGFVKQYAISQKGEELVVNVFKPIAFFPMSWAINNTPNKYFFEAATNVKVWRAPREDIITFIKEDPDVMFNLMSRVFNGTDGLLTRMTYLMAGNAHGRLITELLIYGKRFGKGNRTVSIDISEKDLAAQSGMTRETVSREMKMLKDESLITLQKNRLIINDMQKLEDELVGGV